MKNLELCNYGVQEMNAAEMKITDGGFIQYIIGAVAGSFVYDLWQAGVNHTTTGGYSGGSLHGQWGPR